MINRINVLGKDQLEHCIYTNRKHRHISESDITGVEGDENMTPNNLIEEDDDLDEQDVFDEELA